jgi:hypothetical protein
MKLFFSLICAGISATLIIIVWLYPVAAGWVHIILFVWAVLFAFVALILFGGVIDDRRLDVEERLARIERDQHVELRKLELYARIPPQGWPYMMSERGLVIDATGSQPITKVRLMTGEVPQDFCADVVKHSDPQYVRPVRYYAEDAAWSDGGNCRKYMSMIIQHCLDKQYCGGQPNTPKRWTASGRLQFQFEAGLGIKNLNGEK